MENNQIQKEYGNDVIALNKALPPFQKVDQGFGYKGIVLYNFQEDEIQCHVCGEWKQWLNNRHLITHDLTAWEYKDKFGIYQVFGLTSLNLREKNMIKSTNNFRAKKASIVAGSKKYDYTNRRKRAKDGKGTTMHQNTLGLCDAQLKTRLLDLEKKLKRPLKTTDDNSLACVVRRRFGSWEKGKQELGLITSMEEFLHGIRLKKYGKPRPNRVGKKHKKHG